MANIIDSISNLPFLPCSILSDNLNQFAKEHCDTPLGSLNYLWLTPVSLASNLAGIVLTPIVSLVSLAVAGVLALIGAFSNKDAREEIFELASKNVKNVREACTLGEVIMLGRLLNPSANAGIFLKQEFEKDCLVFE